MAAVVAKLNYTEIFTTTIMIIEPSQEILESLSKFQSPTEVADVLSDVENSDQTSIVYGSDADILLNRLYNDYLVTIKELPSSYTVSDSKFYSKNKTDEPIEAYFISFKNRPLDMQMAGKITDDNAIQAVLAASAGSSDLTANPLSIFWQSYYKKCDGLMTL